VQTLRATHSGNKERLTVEWLQQSISEIRKQLVELQRTAGNVAKDVRHNRGHCTGNARGNDATGAKQQKQN